MQVLKIAMQKPRDHSVHPKLPHYAFVTKVLCLPPQEAESAVDPYIATIIIGLMRFLSCGMTVFLLGSYRRRVLMMLSAAGMAISIAASAYSTSLALAQRDGGSESFLPTWFPMASVVVYILAASIGLQTIPWTMTAEIFPQRVRGAAQALNMVVVHIFMFATLQAYPTMDYYLGKHDSEQWWGT